MAEFDDGQDNQEGLLSAVKDLEWCIDRMKKLQGYYDSNSNYKYIDQADNRRTEADCHLQIGETKRNLLIGLRNQAFRDGGYSEEMRRNQAQWMDDAVACIERALDIYTDIKHTKGEGDCYATLGELNHSAVKDLPKCKELWTRARDVYAECGEKQKVDELTAQLEDLEMEMDAVATIMRKLAALQSGENKEEEAVKAAFEKFDADKSGTMEVHEFADLASELGTYPPLSKEELAEALGQIDNSMDGVITFDEFWAWWVADQLEGK